MPQELRPRVIPIPYLKFILRITHISETILSILIKFCPNVPWMILFQRYVRIPTLMAVYAYKRHIGQTINLYGCRYLSNSTNCLKKNQCIFSSFIHMILSLFLLSHLKKQLLQHNICYPHN